MPVHSHEYISGDLLGVIYTVDNPSEGVRMHRHAAPEAHNVVVLRGSVLIYGPNGYNVRKAVAGDVVDIEWAKWHEIMALEPNTMFFNINLTARPSGYNPCEDERYGHYAITLTHTLSDGGTLVMNPEFDNVFT